MVARVNSGLAPGIPGLADGPGLSQTASLWNEFVGLSGDTSGSSPPTGGYGLVLNSAPATNFTYLIGWY